ncbi:hypothetical protein [Salibacterium qingdaonense]|uniref:Uncharacterized protein n=1 Tax=Salibacterium qingdaonense TaxID=266892 RepID=A0A1I4P4Q3_9BACI|nr:hypothetical protein [Salibacterium qingdaonense]SFM22834.1 hypothetical protein SAMN04488054_12318 [Salibacterium qingdaonense]
MNKTERTIEETEDKRKTFLFVYWLFLILGAASYFLLFIEYTFIIIVPVTFLSGVVATIFTFALRNLIVRSRLLITLGVLLSFSSLIVVGILALIDIVISGQSF